MLTSNTPACFTEFIGHEVIGFLRGGLHGYGPDTKTLVFDDGRGLTINDNGAYWVTSAEEVQRAVSRRQSELKSTKAELRRVIDLAGALRA